MRHSSVIGYTALAALGLVLGGCGASSGESAERPQATVTVTVTAEPTPDTTPGATESVGDGARPLGFEWDQPNGTSIKLLEYRSGAPGAYAPSGERWDAVLVKTCVGPGDPVTLSWLPWRLLDADSGQYES